MPSEIEEEKAANPERKIASWGVNLIVHTPDDTSGSLGQKLLDLGAKHGIGVYIHDTTLLGMRTEENISIARVSERLSAYRNHPAFCGLFVVDEPGGLTYKYNVDGRVDDNMEDYIELTRILKEELEVDFYTNLIQIENTGQEKAYEGYLKEYCESLHPSVMSFDMYDGMIDAAKRLGLKGVRSGDQLMSPHQTRRI